MTVAPLIAVPAVGVNDVIVSVYGLPVANKANEVAEVKALTVQVRATLFTVTAELIPDAIVLV